MTRSDRPLWKLRVAFFAAACLFLAFASVIFTTASASAHASLAEAIPADGAVVADPPHLLTLRFTEAVAPLVLKLIRPDGSTAVLDDPVVRDRVLEIAAPADMGNGTHVLAWRVVSEDGHPIGGSVVFSVGAQSSAPPQAVEKVDWPVRIAFWTVKLVLYAGLFLGVGGVFAMLWLFTAARPGNGPVVTFLLGGLLAAPLAVGVQGLDALAVPLDGITNAAVWKAGFGTSFGLTAIGSVAAIAMALLALAGGQSIGRILSLGALAAVGAGLAASGHAGAAEPQGLTRPMVFVHSVTIAFWGGALIPLWAGLKNGIAAQALRRFSRTIPAVVAMLVAAGLVLAVIQVEQPSALVDTAYGRVLLLKLALLAGLFGLAIVNRRRLTVPVLRGDDVATRRLQRSIAAETALFLLIFAVAACWRFTPPPRVLAIAAAQPAFVHIHDLKAMTEITITPGRTGPVAVSMFVMTGDYAPLDPKEVTLTLAKPDAGIEPIRRKASRTEQGTWRVDDLVVPLPGRWSIAADVLISDFETVKLDSEVEIRP